VSPSSLDYNSFEKLDLISRELRYNIISMSQRAQSSHLGGALSCVDILTSLYWTTLNIDSSNPTNPLRDRLVFSKGHAISALYAVLAKKGFISEADLQNYNKEGSQLSEQPTPHCAPGVEWATGSLGHGLGVGLGMALAAKINNQTYQVYIVMSDGECQEGSVWEAAMLAPKLKLGNLTAIIDFNKWQATARSTSVMAMEPLGKKWESFGWEAIEVDGHNIKEITSAIKNKKKTDTPLAIVAHTIKGKGASFMEDNNNWHYRSPTIEELQKAKLELGLT